MIPEQHMEHICRTMKASEEMYLGLTRDTRYAYLHIVRVALASGRLSSSLANAFVELGGGFFNNFCFFNFSLRVVCNLSFFL